MASQQHPLESSWTLMFLPCIGKQQTATHGSYDNAYKALLKVVGELKTVEAVCSTFNSIPKICQFKDKDFVILSREARAPKYEAFGNDARKIIIDTITEESSKTILDLLLASILGDALKKAVGENPCYVLRMSHRSGFKTPHAVRFEVWMDNPANGARLKAYFDDLVVGFKVEESALKA